MNLPIIFVCFFMFVGSFAAPKKLKDKFKRMQNDSPQSPQSPQNSPDWSNWQQYAGQGQNWTNFVGNGGPVSNGSNGVLFLGNSICINGKCQPYRGSATFQSKDLSCPLAICPLGCISDFRTNPKDDCPICFCNGIGYREPCNTAADCKNGGKCDANVCNYGQLASNVPYVCVFTYECTDSNSDCGPKSKCGPGKRRHEVGKSCVYDNMCSDRFTCAEMTCFEDQKNCHIAGQSCIYDQYNVIPYIGANNPIVCAVGYRCVGMTCRKETC